MGENEVQMENTGQMQESHASSSDKIDLSLDEIIKLNKKEQKANRAKSKRASNRNNVLKKFNQVPQEQRGLRRGAQQYQGPGRLRGLRRQRGARRGMVSRGSSLDRAAATTTGEFDQTTSTLRGTFRGRGRGRGRGGMSRGAMLARGQRGGRPFLLDRGFSATNMAEKLQKYQKIRSQRTAPSGSTLTVSLPNAKSPPVAVMTPNQARRGGAVLRGRSSRGAGTSSPKGIPLQFNYKATTNQTAVSLNDRFTDLRFRGQEWGMGGGRGRGAVGGDERGNTVGGGRGRGRGNIIGTGRGRGRGNIDAGRGRGRGNIGAGRGRGRGNIGAGRGRGNFIGAGRGRGNFIGAGRGNIRAGGRGRGGLDVTRGGRGFTRGRGGLRGAGRTVTLQ